MSIHTYISVQESIRMFDDLDGELRDLLEQVLRTTQRRYVVQKRTATKGWFRKTQTQQYQIYSPAGVDTEYHIVNLESDEANEHGRYSMNTLVKRSAVTAWLWGTLTGYVLRDEME